MAYYTRKRGIELWEPATFQEYAFCICCKSETKPGEKGLESKRGSGNKKDFELHQNSRPGITWKSKLCDLCYQQWKEMGFNLGLCELLRFKK